VFNKKNVSCRLSKGCGMTLCCHRHYEKMDLSLQVKNSALSSLMNHSSRRRCLERCAPISDIIRLHLRGCLLVNPLQSVDCLRNTAEEAIGYEFSVVLIWAVMKSHGWTQKEARFCTRPSCIASYMIGFGSKRRGLLRER